jgi:hypothetical protein
MNTPKNDESMNHSDNTEYFMKSEYTVKREDIKSESVIEEALADNPANPNYVLGYN